MGIRLIMVVLLLCAPAQAAPIDEAKAAFATGKVFGDGQQASHWKDNLGIGIMDPTAAYGELMTISSTDVEMFDVVGWTPVPEPTGAAVLLLGGMAACTRRRRS